MGKRIVLGAHLTDRCKDAPAFQETITRFGCNIKTRIGLHNTGDGFCSGAGLILLEKTGGMREWLMVDGGRDGGGRFRIPD